MSRRTPSEAATEVAMAAEGMGVEAMAAAMVAAAMVVVMVAVFDPKPQAWNPAA